jgi:hypothetical protein
VLLCEEDKTSLVRIDPDDTDCGRYRVVIAASRQGADCVCGGNVRCFYGRRRADWARSRKVGTLD